MSAPQQIKNCSILHLPFSAAISKELSPRAFLNSNSYFSLFGRKRSSAELVVGKFNNADRLCWPPYSVVISRFLPPSPFFCAETQSTCNKNLRYRLSSSLAD